MMFKTWGYVTMLQALGFTNDFKLGHYMKIPPRPMFYCQVVATIFAGTVQLCVQAWLFSHIEGICTSTQKDGFICPATTVFGNASIIVRYIFPQELVPITNITLAVGCHWPTTSLFARPALLRSCILLLAWCSPSDRSVGVAQEVQDWTPEIPEFPPAFHRPDSNATRNTDELCALGHHLLLIQLCDPSPLLQLVGQV